MKDARGIELAVGDKVFYFTRQSSSMYWHVGVIEAIEDVEVYYGPREWAKVKITEEQSSLSDKKRLRTVSGTHMFKVDGLPERGE